ncbi:MAG: fumarylacetoacetate hydrolase family protein, partial [Solirubrobacterales bacterium]|nr:fumarylacetoacetate hydrolase family protein [Solirubrobacterales bacterium]
MRLATVVTSEGPRLYVRGRDGYVDVAQATGVVELANLHALLESGPESWDVVRRAADQEGRPVDESELGPAVPSPRRIICLGVNYADHAAEGGRPPTTWPEVFVRGADSVAPPYAPLVKPALSERFDYEGELGVVIGRGGRYIPAEDALSAIAGFVVCMDGTAREWQRAATQWTAGKNFDHSMPLGPELVTPDEVDVSDAQLTTVLNGELMQSASTSEMIFDVPRTIEFLSSFTTLRPGDVIATGTPAGVGFARQPPVWLQ